MWDSGETRFISSLSLLSSLPIFLHHRLLPMRLPEVISAHKTRGSLRHCLNFSTPRTKKRPCSLKCFPVEYRDRLGGGQVMGGAMPTSLCTAPPSVSCVLGGAGAGLGHLHGHIYPHQGLMAMTALLSSGLAKTKIQENGLAHCYSEFTNSRGVGVLSHSLGLDSITEVLQRSVSLIS